MNELWVPVNLCTGANCNRNFRVNHGVRLWVNDSMQATAAVYWPYWPHYIAYAFILLVATGWLWNEWACDVMWTGVQCYTVDTAKSTTRIVIIIMTDWEMTRGNKLADCAVLVISQHLSDQNHMSNTHTGHSLSQRPAQHWTLDYCHDAM